MVEQKTAGRAMFTGFNYMFLSFLSVICVLPLVNVLAISFSSKGAIEEGLVTFFPVEFTVYAYQHIANNQVFQASMLVSVERVLLGVGLNFLLTILTAYPLSREVSQFRFRTPYVWVFVFTMLFSGGLIPSYVLVKELGLLNSIWALVLPGAVPVFNVVLLLNFFRNLPKELSEAAFIDGAGHWSILWRIMIPLSLPAQATVTLFATVGHWNEWFNGLIYMNNPENYPLSSYLQTIIIRFDLSSITDPAQLEAMSKLNDRALRSAQIFLGALPILVIYPFLQRYFMTGIVLGSVKE
ncbi:carbohydrate ABC transporter permease [Paenibacillus sp.]|uniref:carbohydrate ABC transporter permease n=1 Tax=Paenibacillus sp. TaxID=58172 RepID=UPI002D51683B|nr:carbohydrate ABC transporter permease [Paenibacillus sp.]HZG55916.1 carbohydrate ABC transporter permease [Paenibacillus sp.]